MAMYLVIIDMENRSKREKLMREQGEVVREDRPREVLPVRSEEVS